MRALALYSEWSKLISVESTGGFEHRQVTRAHLCSKSITLTPLEKMGRERDQVKSREIR